MWAWARPEQAEDAMTYTQCKLTQGNRQQTAWIPTEFAKIGKWIILSKNRHAFERTWQVVSCGGTLPSEYVLEHERNYRTQREASDI